VRGVGGVVVVVGGAEVAVGADGPGVGGAAAASEAGGASRMDGASDDGDEDRVSVAAAAFRALNTQHDSVPEGIPSSALAARYPTSIARSVAFFLSSLV